MKIKTVMILLMMAISTIAFSATISVESYGADGSDAIDDATGIQNAINALNSGDTLVFPSGTYLINTNLNIETSNVIITFDSGAKLKIAGTNVSAAIHCTSDSVTFNNLTIDGDYTGYCELGLYLYNNSHITVNNPTITNLYNNSSDNVRAIFLRTCTDVSITGGLFENIIGETGAVAGIECATVGTEHCSGISISDCEFINIRAASDSDGIKFLGLNVDVDSDVSDCYFYNCYKRAIKLQSDNIQISNVIAMNDTMETEYIGGYMIDFQSSSNSSLTDSVIYVSGRNTAGLGLAGSNVTIENVNIILLRKTIEPHYYVFGIRNLRIGSDGYDDFLVNSTVRNVNIYGDFFRGIWLDNCDAGGSNVTLENIYTRSPVVLNYTNSSGNSISNSSASLYNLTGFTSSNCLTTSMPPVAHYKLDETAGITINDASANSNDGTGYSLIYGGTGIIGKAVAFNSSSSYICVPNCTSLSSINHHTTICAWIKPDAIGEYCIVNKKYDSLNTGYDFRTSSSGRLKFRFGDGSQTITVYSDQNAYTSSSWQHVAVVYDSKEVMFYVNGILKGKTAATGRIATNTNNLYIGKYQSSTYYFDGMIDDVKIYNRSLTPFQIKEAAYMRAHYKLNDNGNDETGYNNASVYGSPTNVTAKVDSGYDFNSANTQYIRAVDNDTLDLGSNFTISAWIKPDISSYSTIVNKKYESVADGYELRTYYDDLKLYVNDQTMITTGNILTIGEMQHVAVTFDGINADFYINGDFAERVSLGSSVSPVANLKTLNIAIYQNLVNYKFDGIIDDVRIFDCVLGQDEILELFSEGWRQIQ